MGFGKKVFDLDYSPAIKNIALQTRGALAPGEKVFLYDISDPDLQFYLGDIGENIRGEGNLRHILGQKRTILLTTRVASKAVNSSPGPNRTMILETNDFLLLRTQADKNRTYTSPDPISKKLEIFERKYPFFVSIYLGANALLTLRKWTLTQCQRHNKEDLC